jgi:hypothetical protein
MSIENDWDNLNKGQDEDLTSLLKSSKLIGFTSKNPLEKIKKNLLKNMISVGIICIAYVAIIIFFKIWQVQLLIGVVLLFSTWGGYTAFIQYKNLQTTISTASVLDELKRHHNSITVWIKTQQRVALFIYPISAAGGFLLGGVIGSGKSVTFFLSKPSVLIALIIAIIILTPAAHYLAKWMCKSSFGKYLDALQQNIAALEDEK